MSNADLVMKSPYDVSP
jgi:hypothetical protein